MSAYPLPNTQTYYKPTELSKPDILEVIGQRVALRRRGRDYFGLCPFHVDKNPSFSVNESKQVFYCHGCGESGDVIDFVRKLDGVNFKDACAALGMSAGE